MLNAAIVVFIVAITAAIFGFKDFASDAVLVAKILVGVFIIFTIANYIRIKLLKRS
ncbi:DUF1328 domain-containing protein [Alteromonas sediminis]|uniref:UPF0391 membrane protein DRW07_15130 n=1 Tax=Alteromonas sediminis TaxID=2259342 RepID=A0A3N5Z8R1_9ALTE|nr:DUF1328 domain-containing protein [Alteromonas sediminis]